MSTTTAVPSRAHTQSLIRRHPLISFFVLTYAVAWLLWAPLVVFPYRSPARWHSSFSCWDPSCRPR